MHTSRFVVAVAVSTCALPAAAAPVVISDAAFHSTDWALSSHGYGPFGGTGSAVQTAAGRTGTGREVSNSCGPSFSGVANVSLYLGAVYVPATQGPLSELLFSIDTRFLDGLSAYGFAVEQAGTIWLAGYFLNTSVWQTTTLAPVAADYQAANFGVATTLPDYSAAGAPLRFGFYSGNGSAAGAGYTRTSRFDNFTVAFVPAPGAAGFIALGAASLATRTRRRR